MEEEKPGLVVFGSSLEVGTAIIVCLFCFVLIGSSPRRLRLYIDFCMYSNRMDVGSMDRMGGAIGGMTSCVVCALESSG